MTPSLIPRVRPARLPVASLPSPCHAAAPAGGTPHEKVNRLTQRPGDAGHRDWGNEALGPCDRGARGPRRAEAEDLGPPGWGASRSRGGTAVRVGMTGRVQVSVGGETGTCRPCTSSDTKGTGGVRHAP